jgi:hypothetical protein
MSRLPHLGSALPIDCLLDLVLLAETRGNRNGFKLCPVGVTDRAVGIDLDLLNARSLMGQGQAGAAIALAVRAAQAEMTPIIAILGAMLFGWASMLLGYGLRSWRFWLFVLPGAFAWGVLTAFLLPALR